MLHVIHGNRADVLAGELVRVLADSPAGALCLETVVVESPAWGRWLSLYLAQRTGVCAGVEFLQPNALLRQLFSAVLSSEPGENPFEPGALAWRVLGILPECLGRPEFSELARYLSGDRGGRKLWGLSRAIAGVFDRYALFRPEMILSWEAGQGAGWQPELFRRLSVAGGGLHRAALRQRFLEALDQGAGPALARRFSRVSAFGFGALPPFHLSMLSAASRHLPVYLYHLNPCRKYWADVVADKRMVRMERAAGLGADDLHLEEGNPLLASLGRAGQDFFRTLSSGDFLDHAGEAFTRPEGAGVLAAIQADILDLVDAPAEKIVRPLSPEDDSLLVHACHSPLREMETLYDRILDVLARRPELSPSDVLVLAPDLDAYAPFIQAVFGVPEDPAARLPYSLSAGPARAGASEAFFALLEVCRGRFSASTVLDLLRHPSLARGAGLDEADLAVLGRWVASAGIRWAPDAAFKAALGLPPTQDHTWEAGADRLILGFAMGGADGLFAGILPAPGVEPGDGELLGRFLAFARGVFALARDMDAPRSPGGWADLFSRALADFFPEDGPGAPDRELWAALRGLARVREAWGVKTPLSLGVVLEFLLEQAVAGTSGRGFLSRGVSFAPLSQARGLPFAVICLVGMNEGAFPSASRPPGFDLMAQNFRSGDRDRRMEDRYLFLETILAARDVLHISYLGADPADNSPAPPSAVVSELLDYAAESFSPLGEDPGPGLLTVRHRLHGFHPDYFSDKNPCLFSFSRDRAAAARARRAAETPAHPFAAPLPEPDESWQDVDLNRLCAFFDNPARFLAEKRLQVFFRDPDAPPPPTEPFALDNLERYQIRDRVARECRASGAAPGDLLDRVRAAGLLPHGLLGDWAFGDAVEPLETYLGLVESLATDMGEPLAVDLDLPPFRVQGECGQALGGRMAFCRPSKMNPKDLCRAWVRHLAACAGGHGVETLVVGTDGAQRLEALPTEEAAERLLGLLDLYWSGLSLPLPLFPRASMAYAQALVPKKDTGKFGKKAADKDQDPEADEAARERAARGKARSEWEGGYKREGEGADPYFSWCFPPDPLDAEFTRLAREVFGPLLERLEPVKT